MVMIASLRGEIIDRTIDEVVIECNGVGYALSVSLRTMEQLPTIGDDAFVLAHTVVREDAILLYGFHNAAEREVFRRLISVSGVGPKIALAALSIYSAEELQSFFVHEDERALTRISGVGKKTAQRLLLELRETMGRMLPSMGPRGVVLNAPDNQLSDLELALAGLGYKSKDIQNVLQTLKEDDDPNNDLQLLLRKALKLLQK